MRLALTLLMTALVLATPLLAKPPRSSHRLAEELAREWVYAYGANSTMDDDAETRQKIEYKGLRFPTGIRPTIDDTSFALDENADVVEGHSILQRGMGAMVVEDQATGIVYVVFKGSDRPTKDLGDWLNHVDNIEKGVGIGHKQYNSHRRQLESWARALKGRKVVVVGHSLGGALAQRFAADFVDVIKSLELITLQSPGVDEATAQLLETKWKQGHKLPATYYTTDHEPAQAVGTMVCAPANVVVASGGSRGPASHSEWIIDAEKRPAGMKLRKIRSKDYYKNKGSFTGGLAGVEGIGNTIRIQTMDQDKKLLDGVEVVVEASSRASGRASTEKGVAEVRLRPYVEDGTLITIELKKEGYKRRKIFTNIQKGWGHRGTYFLTAENRLTEPKTPLVSGDSYTGKIYLGRKGDAGYTNGLSLVVGGKSFSGSFSKNQKTYYGIQCYGQFKGTVSDFIDPMSRTVVKDRMRIEGTLTGTCEANDGKESYPLTGKIAGVVFKDGTARGTVDYYAPPFKFTGREFGRYEWSAQR